MLKYDCCFFICVLLLCNGDISKCLTNASSVPEVFCYCATEIYLNGQIVLHGA